MKIQRQVILFGFKHWKGSSQQSYRGINTHKNYYKILEIDQNSDQETIKKSYLKLVKQMHPDVNPSGHSKFT